MVPGPITLGLAETVVNVIVTVVVEKPFVTTSKEADRLIELAKAQGKVLTVFHSESTFKSRLRTEDTSLIRGCPRPKVR